MKEMSRKEARKAACKTLAALRPAYHNMRFTAHEGGAEATVEFMRRLSEAIRYAEFAERPR